MKIIENNWSNLMHWLENDCDSQNKYKLILKEKEIYDKLVAENNNQINTLSQKK